MWYDSVARGRPTSAMWVWEDECDAVWCDAMASGMARHDTDTCTAAHDSAQPPRYDALQPLLGLACQLHCCSPASPHCTTRNQHAHGRTRAYLPSMDSKMLKTGWGR